MVTRTAPPRRVVLSNLRAWREASNLEASKLASLAGVSRRTVARLEAGEACPPRLLQRMADTLGIQPAQLTDPARVPTGPWTYPRRVRMFVGVGRTGRPVVLYWLDWLDVLAMWHPTRPTGFTPEDLAPVTHISVERLADIVEGVAPADGRELCAIARAVGIDATRLLSQD